MIDAGVFGPDERLELIDGKIEIVPMSPRGDRHAACVRRLNELFGQLVAGRAIVDVQNPITVGASYAPQPDVALLRPRSDYFASETPTAADCFLVVEVADTSLELDRQVKAPRYAQGRVVELWLVDLGRDAGVLYRGPDGETYQHVHVFHRRDTITLTLASLAGASVAVQAVLG